MQRLKEANIPVLAKLVDEGYDLVAPIPSCVLMYKQELPLMYPDDADVAKVQAAFYDPFEYLMLRHREGMLNTSFNDGALGKIAYHAACHLRVQNIGFKTRDVLSLVVSSGLPYRDVARIAGTSEANVKVRVHRARVKLRKLMNTGDI